MNLSHLPSEIINMIKDFVFSKIPKDDIRYAMLHPIYANPYRWNFGNLISMGWTFTAYDGKLILFRSTKVAIFDEVLINSEVSNRKRLKCDQILQKREMRRMERKQSHNRYRYKK